MWRMHRPISKTWTGWLLVITLAAYANGQSGSEGSTPCATPAKCNQLGSDALRRGHPDEAIQYFLQQVALAERSGIERESSTCAGALTLTGYNNLALAYFDKHDYLQARAWAMVAQGCKKDDAATRFNLNKIDRALTGWQWPKSLDGEYVIYAGRGDWQTISVESSKADSLHFCFSGLWWGLGEGPSGLGDLDDTVPVRDNVAVYSTNEFTQSQCRITMHFHPEGMEVEQTGSDGDCGFGHNVSASGKYQRISASAKCEAQK